MADKTFLNNEMDPPPYCSVVQDTNTESRDRSDNLQLEIECPVPSAPVLDETIPQSNKQRRIKAKMELLKAKLRKDKIQKQKQILVEDLMRQESAIDAEIELILADLELSDKMLEDFNKESRSFDSEIGRAYKNEESSNTAITLNNSREVNDGLPTTYPNNLLYETCMLPRTNLGINKLSTVDAVALQMDLPAGNGANYIYNVITTTGDVIFKVIGLQCSSLENRYNLNIKIMDNDGIMAISISSNSLNGIDVRVLGRLASVVKKRSAFWRPDFDINDATDKLVLYIRGAHSLQRQYPIYNLNKCRIGLLTKMYEADNRLMFGMKPFMIEFPKELDVNFKAAIIAARLFFSNLFFI